MTYNGTNWIVDAFYYTDSDKKVEQKAAITTAGEYPIILAYSTATTAQTNYVNKTTSFTYNPSVKALTINGERALTGKNYNANATAPYKIVTITQSDYLALDTKDANTLYFIIGA
jgi:hypothetical protein